VGVYVGKILKSAKLGDLPVVQPTKFNIKTAKAPGLEVPLVLGGTAAVVCSRTRPAALPTNRPICDARVPRAIGQSLDWFVSTEAEVLGARVVDWPAAFPLAELEQRASASVVDKDVVSRRLRPPERHHQHLMLGEDVQARTL
jgi:hypothetical protein